MRSLRAQIEALSTLNKLQFSGTFHKYKQIPGHEEVVPPLVNKKKLIKSQLRDKIFVNYFEHYELKNLDNNLTLTLLESFGGSWYVS